MIIENKPGAGAIVATQLLLHAPADGYSLMMASNNLVIGKLLYKQTQNRRIRDVRMIIVGSVDTKRHTFNASTPRLAACGWRFTPCFFGKNREIFQKNREAELTTYDNRHEGSAT
jgi:hypothetical protein